MWKWDKEREKKIRRKREKEPTVRGWMLDPRDYTHYCCNFFSLRFAIPLNVCFFYSPLPFVARCCLHASKNSVIYTFLKLQTIAWHVNGFFFSIFLKLIRFYFYAPQINTHSWPECWLTLPLSPIETDIRATEMLNVACIFSIKFANMCLLHCPFSLYKSYIIAKWTTVAYRFVPFHPELVQRGWKKKSNIFCF